MEVSNSEKENQQELFRIQKQKFAQKMKQKQKVDVRDLVSINKNNIIFPNVIPGNICEEDLVFCNLYPDTIIICVQVLCTNPEYDDLDEYVFSARKLNGYDYNDKFMLACPGQKSFSLKIALKVPNVKNIEKIGGSVLITVQLNNQKIPGQYNVQIESQITKPIIECPKMLMSSILNTPVIQLAFKLGKKLDCKIPFRNNSQISLFLEIEFLVATQELLVQPNQIQVQSCQQFLITILVKSKIEQNIKNVIVIRAKNSNVHFAFPLIIKVY